MKKLFLSTLLLIGAFSLTSCTVNWFGKTADVPWYCVAIPVAVIFVLGYLILMSNTYVCPHCKTEFKAKPHQLYVTIHFGGKRLAKCPNCKKMSYCHVKK